VKEQAPAYSAQGRLMVGPDNAVYVISEKDRVINQAAWRTGSPTSPGMPAAQDTHARHDLRRRLAHLPQMGVAGPC
jgi:hypothetical protein